jgi:hypothetical protein
LHDELRPGKPRSISDADVGRVIVKTLEEQPAGATHWSTRSRAPRPGDLFFKEVGLPTEQRAATFLASYDVEKDLDTALA